MRDKKKYIFIGFLIIVLCLVGFWYLNPDWKKFSESKVLMGTFVNVDVCAPLDQEEQVNQAFIKVWDKFEDIAFRMSAFEETSEVGRLNASFFGSYEVSEDTYRVVKKALEYTKLTDGSFDITVWPLIQLWKKAQERDSLPLDEDLAFVLEATGSENIILRENNSIQLLNPDTKIDLGGIAKGFVVDEAARIFRENGINNFYIDAGGDIYVGGLNCEKKLWKIGVRDPRNPETIMDVLAVTDMAVLTSGNYARFFEIQGKKWSHIINPVTGYPQENVVSSTVVGPKAVDADAFATALSVMGEEKGIVLMDLQDNYEAFILTQSPKGEYTQSETKGYAGFRVRD